MTNNNLNQNPKFELPLGVNVIVSVNNNMPSVMLRKVTNDLDIIKLILSSAYHENPLIIMPKFTDKIKSINSMIEKGLIYRKGNDYYFAF